MLISIVNHKGGTGKTTTALNLSAALSSAGKSTLLIDLDAQCNASQSSGAGEGYPHIGQVLLKEVTAEEAIQEGPKYDLIAAHPDLYSYELRLAAEFDKAYFMQEALAEVREQYEYILIDCPPALSDLVLCALTASDAYMVPMQGENYAYAGLGRLFSMAKRLKKLNPKLHLLGIVKHRFNTRTKFGQMIEAQLEKDGLPLFHTPIRQDISLMEAGYLKQNVLDYAPESNGASDYLQLAQEMIALNENNTNQTSRTYA